MNKFINDCNRERQGQKEEHTDIYSARKRLQIVKVPRRETKERTNTSHMYM